MIKHVSINRFEGYGIIERIEGNGWDIDADRIELNGVNAEIIDDLGNRTVYLNGPAVEDLFKNLRDLLKENSGLRGYVNDMGKNNEAVNYCTTDVLTTETLYLRQTIEEQDECIRHLENGLKEKDAAIKVLQFDKDQYKERCEILGEAIKGKSERIKTLQKELKDKDSEIDELNNKLKKYENTQKLIIQRNNELIEKCADKWDPIKDFIRDTTGDNIDYATVTVSHLMPGYYVTVSVSRQEDDDNG